jgi:GTPase SAR1 family protein
MPNMTAEPNKSEETNRYSFEKLTPVADADSLEPAYEHALDFVFENGGNGLLNIGIIGAYGAGKSSAVMSYVQKKEVQKKTKNFIYVSLAYFEHSESSGSNENDPDQTHIEHELERKILNQIIHQIDPKKIRDTAFKIKKEASSRWAAFYAVLLTIIVTPALLKYADVEIRHIQFSLNEVLGLLLLAACFFVGFFAIKEIMKRKITIGGINVYGNEIVLYDDQKQDNQGGPTFDKYLDEIIYLLEKADVDAIVFDDMDRFKSNSIFVRLREINVVTNKKIQRAEKTAEKTDMRPVRFLYLLKDTTFAAEDRAKFFDFILPIIPVVDSFNSYEKMLEILGNKYGEGRLGIVVRKLSLFVDNMRTVKNICNEFKIYRELLDTNKLEPSILLALMTYKNLFPEDFHKLQQNCGRAYDISQKITSSIEQKTMARISENSVMDLAATNEINGLFQSGQTKNDALLRVMVVEGLIPRHFHPYMSHMYEGSLCRGDKDFVLGVWGGSAQYNYKIVNEENVISQLNTTESFKGQVILNFDLLEWLLRHNKKFQNDLKILLGEASKIDRGFLLEFMSERIDKCDKNLRISLEYDTDSTENAPEMEAEYLIRQLNDTYWPTIFSDTKGMSERVKKFYVTTTLVQNPTKVDLSPITKFASEYKGFLNVNIDDSALNILAKNLKDRNIQIEQLDQNEANEKLVQRVYGNNSYALNFGNISYIMRKIYNIGEEDVKNQNYTSILNLDLDS